MAVVDGVLSSSGAHVISASRPTWLSLERPHFVSGGNANSLEGSLFGGVIDNLPVDSMGEAVNAVGPFGYQDIFYYKVYLDPVAIDFGNAVGGKTIVLYVWNAFFSTNTLNSISEDNLFDVAVTSVADPPTEFQGLEARTFSIQLGADGVAVVSGAFVFDFDSGSIRLPVAARRVIPWTFEVDWSQSYGETLAYLTDIISSFKNNEQRRELRSKPRRSLSYGFQVKGVVDSAYFQNLLYGWQNRQFAVPIEHDVYVLPYDLTAGTQTLSLQTGGRGFSSGGQVMLKRAVRDYELVEVDEVSANSLLLASPIMQNWPAGTKLYPVNIGRLPTKLPTQRLTDQTIAGRVLWQMDPVSTNPHIPALPAEITFNDIEVIDRRPDWAQAPSYDSEIDYLIADNMTGAIDQIQTEDYAHQIRSYRWLLRGRDDIASFRGLLGRLKGRRKSVYIPTWFTDFYLASDAYASDTSILVLQSEYSRFVLDLAMQAVVMIRLRDGTYVLKNILGASDNDSESEFISFDSPLGRDISVADVLQICLVHRRRLVSDSVSIDYKSATTAYVEAGFKSVIV